MESVECGVGRNPRGPDDAILPRVGEALGGEGLEGVAEIEVRKAVQEKPRVDGPRHIVPEASDSPAQAALALEPDLGLLLPCNVVVYNNGPRAVRSPRQEPRSAWLTTRLDTEALAPSAAQAHEKVDCVLSGV